MQDKSKWLILESKPTSFTYAASEVYERSKFRPFWAWEDFSSGLMENPWWETFKGFRQGYCSFFVVLGKDKSNHLDEVASLMGWDSEDSVCD